jgi:hypothetical protein
MVADIQIIPGADQGRIGPATLVQWSLNFSPRLHSLRSNWIDVKPSLGSKKKTEHTPTPRPEKKN